MTARIAMSLVILLTAGIIAAGTPDQPFMQAARADLQTAKRELQQATANKGGHRGNAIGLISQAIAQVNQGINFDRRHNHPNFSASADQPHMTAALAALESAKNNLERATSDKGGHRANALDLVKDAIKEVKKGIDAAN